MNIEGIKRVREIMSQPISEEAFADPVWRIGNLYTCITKEGVEVVFKPNDAQCDVLNEVFLEGHRRVLILKARQLGMSTLIAIIGLDYVLTHENSTFNIQSHNDEAAKDLLREKVIQPFNQLDDSLKATVDVVNSNLNELVFSPVWKIRSKVKIRGGTSQVLHISEWGKVAAKDPIRSEEILTGALPTAGEGAIVFIESTYEGGQAGHFYNQVMQSMNTTDEHRTKMDFKFLFYPWFDDSRYRMIGNEELLTQSTIDYFLELEEKLDRKFSLEQKIWWQKQSELLGIFMGREFPSTPEEAMAAPVEGAIYADVLEIIRRKGQFRNDLPVAKDVPVWAVWDLGFRDYTAIWLVQWDGISLKWLWFTQGSQKQTSEYVAEIHKSGYNVYGHILPHDAAYMDKTGTKNYVMELRACGGENVKVVPRTKDVWKGINDLRSLLHKSYFYRPNMEDGLKMLQQYRAKKDDSAGIIGTVPVHDFTSHAADAARYVAEGIQHGLLSTQVGWSDNRRNRPAHVEEPVNGF
jgi:hypothetical protein